MNAFFALPLLAGSSSGAADDPVLAQGVEPAFVANAGQWNERALARLRFPDAAVWLTRTGWTLDLRDEERAVALEFHVEDAKEPVLELEEQREAVQHFYLGDDPERWRSGLATFGRARLQGLQHGVDLVLRLEEGHLEYDFDLHAGVDVANLAIEVRGAERLRLTERGELVLETALGEVVQSAPRTFARDDNGELQPVESEVILLDETRFGFRVNGHDGQRALTIDPGLEWSSFLGASEADMPNEVELDALGRAVVAGMTAGFEFPVSPGAYDIVLKGTSDVFVTCFAHGGTGYVWSTFLGGSDGESLASLLIEPSRQLVLGGETRSSDFPTTAGVIDSSHNGLSDVFVTRLERDGSALLTSTLLGTNGIDTLGSMERLPNGDLAFGGATNSGSFPSTPGTVQPNFQGGPFTASDAFVAIIDPGFSTLVRATFLGSTGSESVTAMAIGPGGTIRVGGRTTSSGFGLFNALDGTFGGVEDGFLVELNPTMSAMNWSSFVGGSGEDRVTSIETRSSGGLLVGGWSDSMDFPATAFQVQPGGGRDAFVASYAANGSALEWSTLLGGANDDELHEVVEDSTGRPVAVGETDSRFFPVTRWGFQAWFRGPYPVGTAGDGWMARLEADGSDLAYGTFIGGNRDDAVYAIALSDDDVCTLVGQTLSINFPTTLGAVDRVLDFSGFGDAFALSLDFSRYPFTYGVGKPTSIFTVPYLLWTGFPGLTSNTLFRISIEEACPNTGMGALFVSSSPASVPMGTGTRYIGTPVRRAAVTNLGLFGSGTMTLPVEPWMVGRTLYYQFVFQDPGAANGVGLSEGLEVTFHP